MKFLILFSALMGACLAMPQDTVEAEKSAEPEIGLRAPSSFQNCDCQCDSYTWTSNGKILGNCLSPDATNGNFCYVSGRAVRACRDVQESATRKDSFSDYGKFYSYEACSTPPRNQCYNTGGPIQNIGDGDRPAIGGGYPGGFGGQGPFNGGSNLGNILGIRTAGEGETADATAAAAPAVEAGGDKPDSSAITFADA